MTTPSPTQSSSPDLSGLGPILEQLGASPADFEDGGSLLIELTTGASEQEVHAKLEEAGDRWAEDGLLLVRVQGANEDEDLASARNKLWPAAHVNAVVSARDNRWCLSTLQKTERLPQDANPGAPLLACRRTAWVLSPQATQEKFDQNAAGWNGNPGSPGYRHFRWMRRFVAEFTPPAEKGSRILDFGCGAGWVGIEAVLAAGGASLCSFDPSPEMVRITADNAKQEGIHDFTGRVGFGEEPPFPGPGEQRYDLVLSSGVISFARDMEAWMRGLTNAVNPGGTLVIGDINASSRGMKKRRSKKPLVPVREMNAQTAESVRKRLEAKGYTHEETAGYQLTTPVPQAMHFNEKRLGGVMSVPLVFLNRALTQMDRTSGNRLGSQFDSWVMRFRAPI